MPTLRTLCPEDVSVSRTYLEDFPDSAVAGPAGHRLHVPTWASEDISEMGNVQSYDSEEFEKGSHRARARADLEPCHTPTVRRGGLVHSVAFKCDNSMRDLGMVDLRKSSCGYS